MKEFYFKIDDDLEFTSVAVIARTYRGAIQRACAAVYHSDTDHLKIKDQIEACLIDNISKFSPCEKEYFLKHGDV